MFLRVSLTIAAIPLWPTKKALSQQGTGCRILFGRLGGIALQTGYRPLAKRFPFFSGFQGTLIWGTSKQHMKLQQPRNYDFRVSQFDLPVHERTTSPPGHHGEAKFALKTTAKLQQLHANSREMTTFAESCNDREMQ